MLHGSHGIQNFTVTSGDLGMDPTPEIEL